MGRSGYTDDCENVELWRGTVTRAIRGKRGQKFLIELRDALDAMPEKVLISGVIDEYDYALVNNEGDTCALGAVGKRRGLAIEKLDPEDWDALASTFDVARSLIQEIEYENDEGNYRSETPQQRWERMRKWVDRHIIPAEPA